ncbi:Proline racemase [Moelleriella libera RCEF 2490]|uniref:trans-L-3-hydroxyproline dehydratase n=1 Tax=Moelleriella libera RCEF 2490 TaxID=1081109 RepID=A0A166V5K1_9HYPO|nr:Proline racemase [Moelleriella libera RCEF 2490]
MSEPSFWIETEDWHTAGEPFRIVDKLPDGYLPNVPTVSERRFNIMETANHPLDELRRILCHEPRGHADMYGGFITPPDDPGAHFGVLFWHKDGFSTACGHATIALGYWAVSHGLVEIPGADGTVDVIIDVPSGRVVARMCIEQRVPVHADFINVASFQIAKSLPLTLTSSDVNVVVDMAFAGALYVTLDTAQIGLGIEPENRQRFIQLAREIKAVLGTRARYGRYDCYGVIFFSEREGDQSKMSTIVQRNILVFADGQIDRSPSGSGTCARLAILFAQGRLGPGHSKLLHHSIIGSKFEADIVSEIESPVEAFPACKPRVRGRAALVGRMKFFVDPRDDVFPGFLLR